MGWKSHVCNPSLLCNVFFCKKCAFVYVTPSLIVIFCWHLLGLWHILGIYGSKCQITHLQPFLGPPYLFQSLVCLSNLFIVLALIFICMLLDTMWKLSWNLDDYLLDWILRNIVFSYGLWNIKAFEGGGGCFQNIERSGSMPIYSISIFLGSLYLFQSSP